jgi:hypothetical protein
VSEKELLNSHEGISRRRMLKRIGAGAAVAWSAPVITSLSSPAFAQTTPRCEVDWQCGDPIDVCGEGDGEICVCDLDTEGRSFCWNDFSCGDPNAVPCNSSDDCAGNPFPRCASSCCGQVCSPECLDPAAIASARRYGGLKASGR